MPLTHDDITELIACVRYYQTMHVSLHSPRYGELQNLLDKLDALHDRL